MRSYFVTFRSVTYAQRAERILKDGGLRCTLQRSPSVLEERGCGYGLKLRQQDGPGAMALLRRAGVPLRKVYIWDADGRAEEAIL